MRRLIAVFAILALFPIFSFAKETSGKLIFKQNSDKFTTSFESDYRYGEEGLYHRHYDIGIKIPFSDGWSTSINYRSVYKFKNSKNKWRLEKRPYVSLKKIFNTQLLKSSLRTRQEYRYKADGTQSTRNRTKLVLKCNKPILSLKPFIGAEIFYDMDEEKYNKNFLIAGVEFPKSKLGKYSLYYNHVMDLEEDGSWDSGYRVVLKVVFEM